MPHRVDLHIHSCYSLQDGLMAPKTVVRLAKHLGYSAVAVTDHYDYDGALKGTFAARRLAAEAGITSYAGTEYTVSAGPVKGHVLVYFDSPEQAPRRGLTLDGLVDHARAEGLTLVHPHPYGFMGIARVDFMRRADYVELNGSYRHGPANRKLRMVLAAAGLGHKMVANSDAHARGQMGAAYTRVAEIHGSVADTLRTKTGCGIGTPKRAWGKAAKLTRAVFAPVGLAMNAVQMIATGRALRALPPLPQMPGLPTLVGPAIAPPVAG